MAAAATRTLGRRLIQIHILNRSPQIVTGSSPSTAGAAFSRSRSLWSLRPTLYTSRWLSSSSNAAVVEEFESQPQSAASQLESKRDPALPEVNAGSALEHERTNGDRESEGHDDEHDDVEQCLRSIGPLAARLRSSLLFMAGTQIMCATYLWFYHFKDPASTTPATVTAFFTRFAILSAVVPFTITGFLPNAEQLTEPVKALTAICNFLRRSDAVVGLAAIVLLVASLYDILHPYVAAYMMEAGNAIQRMAREDLEKLKGNAD